MALARERGLGLVLESPTWRASPGWAAEIGYSEDELDRLNRRAIALLATELDEGDAADLGARTRRCARRCRSCACSGGCCGTDHRHVREIRDAWLGAAAGGPA